MTDLGDSFSCLEGRPGNLMDIDRSLQRSSACKEFNSQRIEFEAQRSPRMILTQAHPSVFASVILASWPAPKEQHYSIVEIALMFDWLQLCSAFDPAPPIDGVLVSCRAQLITWHLKSPRLYPHRATTRNTRPLGIAEFDRSSLGYELAPNCGLLGGLFPGGAGNSNELIFSAHV